jgi:Zn-dependent alcohol dehydrogenase
MMVRAAVLQSVGRPLELRDDLTAIGPGLGEVKIRIRATGICHTDLSVMAGKLPCRLPSVLGHEAAGDVVEVGGEVSAVRDGDHVVINGTPACGLCADCLRGRPTLCITHVAAGFTKPRFRMGVKPVYGMAGAGTWAEEVIIPWQGAVKIDPTIPFEYAAVLGCAVPTGVGAVLNTAKVCAGSSVAVIGAGAVGLSILQGARIADAATILVIDPIKAKHPVAQKLGATHVVTPDGADDASNLLTGGRGFDYVFEAVGTPATIEAAWRLTMRGGELVIVGAGGATDMVTFSAFELLFEGKTIKASMYGDADMHRDVPTLVDHWRAGRLDLETLVTQRIRFEELNDATHAVGSGHVVRQVVVF